MSLAPQKVAAGFCVATSAIGLTACSDRRVEDARMACTVVMQSLYRPVSDNEPVTFEPVANVSPDSDKFEFVWKQSQIRNMTFSLTMADIVDSERHPSGNYVMVIERAGVERQYVCRGSLGVRSLHGIWVRQTDASRQARDIKVTKYPVGF